MSKIERLETIHIRLAIRRRYFVSRLLRLYQYQFTPETFEEYTKSVGQATVMQAEIQDHCNTTVYAPSKPPVITG